MFKNLDIKTIFILILAVALILMFIFGGGGNKGIDNYKDELNNLKEQNDSLLHSNDDLKNKNDDLTIKYDEIIDDIIEIDGGLNNNSGDIANLQDEKDKVADRVRVLNADGVAIELSNYFIRRESQGND